MYSYLFSICPIVSLEGEKVTMINLDERQLKIVPSVMKLGKKSVRTLDGGDPRSVFSRFKEGEIIVMLTKKEYESMKSVIKEV